MGIKNTIVLLLYCCARSTVEGHSVPSDFISKLVRI